MVRVGYKKMGKGRGRGRKGNDCPISQSSPPFIPLEWERDIVTSRL